MPRRASAPRLIDWTGERCVPWTDDVQVVYEHLHRYLWARDLVAGQDVLDLGSGEGFGTSFLAESARSVHGIDVDAQTVEHARLNYSNDNLSFAVGDALDLPEELTDRFDTVVAFEVLEHVVDHERLMAQIRRVLRPGGRLIISTPNRLLYAAEGGANPYHLHELSDVEFTDFIGEHFVHHARYVQRVQEGSRLDLQQKGAQDAEPFRVEQRGSDWFEVGAPPPFYLIAVASDEPLPELRSSTLVDHSLGLLDRSRQLTEQRVAAAAREADARLQQAAAERERLERELKTVGDWGKRESRERERLELAEAEARSEVHRLAAELIAVRDQKRAADAAANDLGHALALTNESVTWRGLQKAKRKLRGEGDRPRLAARAVSASLRTASRVQDRRKSSSTEVVEPVAPEPVVVEPLLTVPSSEHPEVSIVIPVYADAQMTLTCLRSIVAASEGGPAYEVIVADDCAPEDVQQMLAAVQGIRVRRNPENLGFLRSVNAAVEDARAPIVLLLNNDTEPQIGWLAPLVDRLANHPGIGAVGGRLVYPDGSLQEAGGVLFADGSAINYGNGSDPGAAAFRFARPVDYCSAALLAIRTDVWNELGGFDELFVPGYYEDTDLCFRMRQAGYEVWFEPTSVVIHKEGGSHGTDTTQGVKRYQVVNQQHFVDRWGPELVERPPTATPTGAWMWANRTSGPVVFIADHMVPEPDRDSGSLRMFQVIRTFVDLGARVIFHPANGHRTPGYAEALEAIGVEVLDGGTNLFARLEDLRAVCRLAILSRPAVAAQLLADIRTHLPAATVVYDTVDLHWVREQARMEFEPVPQATVDALREIELAIARASDHVAVVTQEESRLLGEIEPGIDVRYLPNVHELPKETPGLEGRRGLLFVGGFRHHPNVDAARLLGERIMPAVRNRGISTSLTIVGPDAPPEVDAFEAPDIHVTGWVPAMEPLLDGSLALIAPLRYGAGMKGKIGQALAHGLPVITTAIGAQGFGLVDGENALLAEEPDEFAAAVERLQGDPELWRRLSENGKAVIERTCSTAVVRSAVEELLALSVEPAGAAAE